MADYDTTPKAIKRLTHIIAKSTQAIDSTLCCDRSAFTSAKVQAIHALQYTEFNRIPPCSEILVAIESLFRQGHLSLWDLNLGKYRRQY